MQCLTDCRERIDAIDDQIIDLLAKRYAVVRSVIDIKLENDLPARIPTRIDEVIDRVTGRAEGTAIPEGLVARLYRDIIEYACKFEEKTLVK